MVAVLFGMPQLLWHNCQLNQGAEMTAKTLYDKLWDSHVVRQEADGTVLLYIDRHLVHEVTSPQAFEGLKLAHRNLWRTSSILAVADHNVPTTNRAAGIADPVSRLQVDTLDANCAEFKVTEFKMNDVRQGIVHVIGPEQGATLPGMTVVCGDSHTSTHGAFAALAHGIGTSEVEHVMATQCLMAKKSKAMLVKVEGTLGKGVTAKDIALAVIGVFACNPIYCKARSQSPRLPASVAVEGSGTRPSTDTTISGEVPQVTCGLICVASNSTVASNLAPTSLCKVRQYSTALSQFSPCGAKGRPLM